MYAILFEQIKEKAKFDGMSVWKSRKKNTKKEGKSTLQSPSRSKDLIGRQDAWKLETDWFGQWNVWIYLLTDYDGSTQKKVISLVCREKLIGFIEIEGLLGCSQEKEHVIVEFIKDGFISPISCPEVSKHTMHKHFGKFIWLFKSKLHDLLYNIDELWYAVNNINS